MPGWLRGRQCAQSIVEFGLIVAAVAVVGMLGLQAVTTAQKVYFGDVASALAPPSAAVPGDILHTVFLSMTCNPSPVLMGGTTTCTVHVTDLDAAPTPPQGSVKTNVSSGPPPSDCTPLQTVSQGDSSCSFTFTPTASQFGQLTLDLKYDPKNSKHVAQPQSFPITVIGLSTIGVTCTNAVLPSLGPAVEAGHPIGCVAQLAGGSAKLQGPLTWTEIAPSAGPATFTCSTTNVVGSCAESGNKTSATCTTDSNGTCKVIFRPGLNPGSDRVHVEFGGDTLFQASYKDVVVNVVGAVGQHSTGVSVSCPIAGGSNGNGGGDHAHCTATVSDTDPLPNGQDAYDRSAPAGTVNVVLQDADPSQLDSTTNSCRQGLTQFSPDYSTCTFDIDKHSGGNGGGGDRPEVMLQYSGDILHAPRSLPTALEIDFD